MSTPAPTGGEVVTVLTAGTKPDRHSPGNTVEDWTDPTERDVATVIPLVPFQLEPAGEPVQDTRNSLTHGWVLYLPPTDPITAKDRVRVRGEVYPVQGPPAAWPSTVVANVYTTEG